VDLPNFLVKNRHLHGGNALGPTKLVGSNRHRCGASAAHIRQSRPDPGLGLRHFLGKDLSKVFTRLALDLLHGSEEGSYSRLIDFLSSLNPRLKNNKHRKRTLHTTRFLSTPRMCAT
jgi:hypothetical protein